jgi:hypothetical protein
MLFAEFISEPTQGVDQFFHKPLGAGNLFLKPLALTVTSYFNVSCRTLIPNNIWAISSRNWWLILHSTVGLHPMAKVQPTT